MPRLFVILALLSVPVGSPAFAAERAAELVIEHVTLLPMTVDGAPISNATVTIRDGRIASIGPARTVTPRGARRIDGRGKFLMPGFTDMHMHLENDRLMRIWSGD
jgi:imidazolonepropionase-like amidohydrolase